MKRRVNAKWLFAGAGFILWGSAVFLITSTLAWFSNNVIAVDEDISGSTKGAYFAGGIGTESDPYQIASPVHLYNLAWLQDIGYFNKDSNGVYPYNENGDTYNESSVDTTYFVLNNDIDMSGWKIPPIGTKKYPFIGQFNGQGHTVNNLTSTNDDSALLADSNPHPNGMSSSMIDKNTDVNIAGFFGVVGAAPTNTYTYTYSSITPRLTNFGLKSSSIETVTNGATLIGLAAGYVNGEISGVGVNSSSIKTASSATATTYTSNLSDHSLVGYEANSSQKGQLDKVSISEDIPTVTQQVTSGAGDQWGGSIGMNQMYSNVKAVLNGNTSSRPTYVSEEARLYDENGVLTDTIANADSDQYVNSSGTITTSSNNAWGYLTNSYTEDSHGNQTASYSIFKRSNISGDPYLYLYGEKTNTFNNSKTVKSHTITEASVITDGAGHYLTINNNGNVANASLNNALGWVLDQSGHIYTFFNNRTYYLNSNNSSLSVSTTASTSWTEDTTLKAIYYRVNNGDESTYYCLRYNNGWGIQANQAKYTFYYNGYYINATTSGITSDTTATTVWHVYMNNSDAYPYFTSGNNNYYLNYNSGSLNLSTSRSSAFYISGSALRHQEGWLWPTNYYINPNGNSGWSISTAQTKFTINKTFDDNLWSSVTTIDSSTKTTYTQPTTTTESSSFHTNPTYFPIGWDENNPTEISRKNTGYVVSGANYASQPGDIRVSQYGNGYLWNSLNLSATTSNGITKASDATFGDAYDSKLEVLTRTANSGGFVRVSDSHNANNDDVNSTMSNYTKMTVEQLGFQKYATSRNALYNPNLQTNKGILAQDTNVYGLHFMDAQITINHLVTAPHVSIDGHDYSNYQLPEDCIDFNLRKSGFINFFAGSYFPGNTTFFSLHQISRNETTKAITGIKEISEIYENEDPTTKKRTPYVYKYSDQTYSSVGTISNNATPVFDMSWVTSPTMVEYAMYYFEIPVNGGEYALGSVNNKNGAYLIYLDIGASKYNVNTLTVEEKKTTTTDTSLYPLGIDFTTGTSYSTITGGDTAAVKVPASAKGETITYTMSGSTLEVTGDTGSYVRATHIAEGYAATDGVSPLTTADITSTRVVEEKTTESIYNESGFDDTHNYALKVDTVTTTYINDVQQGNPVSVEGVQELSEITTYNSTITMGGTSTPLVSFHYYAKSGVNVNVSLVYVPAEEDEDLDGTYAISITSNADITIYIDNVTSTITYAGEDEASRLHKFAATVNGTSVLTGDTIAITGS